MAISQQGKWEEWPRFFLRGISTQAQDSIFRMTRLQGIHTRYDELVRADNNPQRMSAVIDFLFSRPILTLRQLESALDIPYMAAKRYVDKLVAAGVLRETTGMPATGSSWRMRFSSHWKLPNKHQVRP